MRRIERIAAVAEVLVVPGRSGGKLRHVQRAEVDGAGRIEPRERGRGGARAPVAADFRAAGRDAAGAVEHVLVRERHAVQRAADAPAGKLGAERGGLLERACGVDGDETIEPRLPALDARERRFGGLDRRELPRTDCRRGLRQGHERRIGNCRRRARLRNAHDALRASTAKNALGSASKSRDAAAVRTAVLMRSTSSANSPARASEKSTSWKTLAASSTKRDDIGMGPR